MLIPLPLPGQGKSAVKTEGPNPLLNRPSDIGSLVWKWDAASMSTNWFLFTHLHNQICRKKDPLEEKEGGLMSLFRITKTENGSKRYKYGHIPTPWTEFRWPQIKAKYHMFAEEQRVLLPFLRANGSKDFKSTVQISSLISTWNTRFYDSLEKLRDQTDNFWTKKREMRDVVSRPLICCSRVYFQHFYRIKEWCQIY